MHISNSTLRLKAEIKTNGMVRTLLLEQRFSGWTQKWKTEK
jgi:hypothetical protein